MHPVYFPMISSIDRGGGTEVYSHTCRRMAFVVAEAGTSCASFKNPRPSVFYLQVRDQERSL